MKKNKSSIETEKNRDKKTTFILDITMARLQAKGKNL